MNKKQYVYAVVKYTDIEDEVTNVIYIAPKEYWDKVEDLSNYYEENDGEVEKELHLKIGANYTKEDSIHYLETTKKAISEISGELDSIGMEYSDSLEDYAHADVEDFGDKYIAHLYGDD